MKMQKAFIIITFVFKPLLIHTKHARLIVFYGNNLIVF